MSNQLHITSPEDRTLDDLCDRLAAMATDLDRTADWPRQQLQLCGEHGVYRWFLPKSVGGLEWSDAEIARGYQKLSAGCLTTTFVITQYTGASRRIASSTNDVLKTMLLPQLLTGQIFATVGISHLTTSRRHLRNPVLLAQPVSGGFQLDGMAPWVTGSTAADVVVVAASLEDGRELLASIPTNQDTLHIPAPESLVALTASKTGRVEFNAHFVPAEQLLAGPIENVMSQGMGAKTGGLQTSVLAVGLATAATRFLRDEAIRRAELTAIADAFRQEVDQVADDIQRMSLGEEVCTKEQLRTRANSLALRSTQAALSAAKGTGFITGHPAGRWCREALFFLVWSCPQPVVSANLCELAGIAD